MRVRITFEFKGKLHVPIHHQYLINGLIYACIRDEDFRDHLHNTGYQYGKRQYRMFCYSKLRGKYKIINDKIEFVSPVSFIFSTYDERLLQEMVSSLFTKDEVMIGHQKVKVSSIEQVDNEISDNMIIRFITPITVYSTFIRNNKKKTYFFSPSENEFNEIILANICRKFEAIHGIPPESPHLSIKPIVNSRPIQKSVMFNKTLIKGWFGDFQVQGKKELIQLAFDVGMGSKGSNGMGVFEVIRHLKRGERVPC